MINSLQLLKQFDEQISSSELTTAQRKILLSKYADLLLAQLEVGDSIEGVIAKISDSKYVLQVKPNISIPIHMLEQLESGKLMAFTVQGKESGKLFLQPSYAADIKQMPLIQKTLEELNLPKTPAMQEVVDDFLQKHLPLAKEMLLKVYLMSKEYEVPSKIITNFMDNEGVFSPKEISTLSALRTNGINDIVTDFKYIIQGLDHADDLIEIFGTLKNQVSGDKLNAIINKLTAGEINHNFTREMTQIPVDAQKKLLGESLYPKDIKGLHDNISMRDNLIKLFNQDINKLNIAEHENIFKKVIGELYDEVMMVQLENLEKNSGESEKIYNTYNLLAKLVKTLDKANLSNEDKDYMNYIKEPLSLLGKFNMQADYFIFPILTENKQMQGEMYFFKSKKTTKKDRDNMYIVLALSLPYLNNIEIHINKQEKNISLIINVEKEDVQKHISQYMPKLNEQIQGLGFSVSSITWGIVGADHLKNFSKEDYLVNQLNHMDFKI